MTRFNFHVSFTIISIFAVVFLAGCSSQTETKSNENSSINRPPANSAPPSNVSPNISTVNAVRSPSNSVTRANRNPQPPAQIPQAKIGSGGNDFSLLASVRSALSGDKELLNNVVVDVKEGSVTLNGKVSSDEQKKKAEELVRGVQSIKSVKNNLRIAP